jgi:glycerol uptake facilitator-like aquaporin
MAFDLNRRLAGEAIGAAALALAVVGSGMMGEQLAGGNLAIALLAVTGVTVFALSALIAVVGPLSGAHLNPVVSVSLAMRRVFAWNEVPAYIACQTLGACCGALLAHALFSNGDLGSYPTSRAGFAMWSSEVVATFGLVLVIWCCLRLRPEAIVAVVPAYIGAGFWSTPSTCFSNPALTVARSLTGSFTGIQLGDVLPFVLAQFGGALLATWVARWLLEPRGERQGRAARNTPEPQSATGVGQ